MKKRLVLYLTILCFLPLSMQGQTAVEEPVIADTLSIHFRLDSINIDMDFENNAAAWAEFKRKFEQRYSGKSPHTIRLDIYSGASPEGTAAHNRWLGENRGIAVRRLVREGLGDRIDHILIHNEAARWEGLYDMVAGSSEPWREDVLRILELPTSHDPINRDYREELLRQLDGGKVWDELFDRYLSPLRSGATAILTWQARTDTVYVRERVINIGVGVADSALVAATAAAVAQGAGKSYDRRPVWILRSNLPLLALATPNAQAEFSLDHKDRWSVNVEGIFAWWTFGHNAYANEIIYGSAELRYWLGNRSKHHTLDGWHVGFGVGGGYYDFEWKSKGYQGEVVSAWVNVGWQRRFGKRKQWAFDAGVGLGYLYTPYRRYHGSTIYPEHHTEWYDDHLMWRETNRLNWLGTPHFNISLGYVFTSDKAFYKRATANYLHGLEEKFADSSELLERQIDAERDSVYNSWMALPKSERKAVQRAYYNNIKAARKAAKAQSKQDRENQEALIRGEKVIADKKAAEEQKDAEKTAKFKQESADKAAKAAAKKAAAEKKAADKAAKAAAKKAAAEKKTAEKAAERAAKAKQEAAERAAKAQKKAAKKAAKEKNQKK